jgi:hypothetical protein
MRSQPLPSSSLFCLFIVWAGEDRPWTRGSNTNTYLFISRPGGWRSSLQFSLRTDSAARYIVKLFSILLFFFGGSRHHQRMFTNSTHTSGRQIKQSLLCSPRLNTVFHFIIYIFPISRFPNHLDTCLLVYNSRIS